MKSKLLKIVTNLTNSESNEPATIINNSNRLQRHVMFLRAIYTFIHCIHYHFRHHLHLLHQQLIHPREIWDIWLTTDNLVVVAYESVAAQLNICRCPSGRWWINKLLRIFAAKRRSTERLSLLLLFLAVQRNIKPRQVQWFGTRNRRALIQTQTLQGVHKFSERFFVTHNPMMRVYIRSTISGNWRNRNPVSGFQRRRRWWGGGRWW